MNEKNKSWTPPKEKTLRFVDLIRMKLSEISIE